MMDDPAFLKFIEEQLEFKRIHNDLAFALFSELYLLENGDVNFLVGELKNPN